MGMTLISRFRTRLFTVVGCVFLYSVIIGSIFFVSFYAASAGQAFMFALLLAGAYVGYKLDDYGLSLKLLLVSCVAVSVLIYVFGNSDILAFLRLLQKSPEWFLTIDNFFHTWYWGVVPRERWSFLVFRLVLSFSFVMFIVGLIGNILGFLLLGTVEKEGWTMTAVSPPKINLFKVVGCVFLFFLVVVSVFFLSIYYPEYPGAMFLIALLTAGAYIGRKQRRLNLFFITLLAGSVSAGTTIFYIVGGNLPAFLALLKKTQNTSLWLRAINPFFDPLNWSMYPRERYIVLAFVLVVTYTVATFIIATLGNVLRYIISIMTVKKP